MNQDYTPDPKAPFNMAIATLLSLRNTLDRIRDIEGRIDYPASERQRIKIELVKRFYVDSAPLINKKGFLEQFKWVLDIKPKKVISIDRSSMARKVKVVYCYELNSKLDKALMDIQLEMQKSGTFMPPSDDMSTIGAKMS